MKRLILTLACVATQLLCGARADTLATSTGTFSSAASPTRTRWTDFNWSWSAQDYQQINVTVNGVTGLSNMLFRLSFPERGSYYLNVNNGVITPGATSITWQTASPIPPTNIPPTKQLPYFAEFLGVYSNGQTRTLAAGRVTVEWSLFAGTNAANFTAINITYTNTNPLVVSVPTDSVGLAELTSAARLVVTGAVQSAVVAGSSGTGNVTKSGTQLSITFPAGGTATNGINAVSNATPAIGYLTLTNNLLTLSITGATSGGGASIGLINSNGLLITESGTNRYFTVTNSPLVGGLASDAFVLKSGDTMTGALLFNGGGASISVTNGGYIQVRGPSSAQDRVQIVPRAGAVPPSIFLDSTNDNASIGISTWTNGVSIWSGNTGGERLIVDQLSASWLGIVSNAVFSGGVLGGKTNSTLTIDGSAFLQTSTWATADSTTNYARLTVNGGAALYGYKNVFTYDGSSGVNMSEKRTDIRTTNTAADVFDVYAQNNNGTMDNNRGGLTIWNFGAAYTSSYAAGMRSPTLALGLHSSTSANQGVIMFTSARGTNDTQHDFLIWNGSTAGGSKQVLMISAEGDIISSNTITAASFIGNGAGLTNLSVSGGASAITKAFVHFNLGAARNATNNAMGLARGYLDTDTATNDIFPAFFITTSSNVVQDAYAKAWVRWPVANPTQIQFRVWYQGNTNNPLEARFSNGTNAVAYTLGAATADALTTITLVPSGFLTNVVENAAIQLRISAAFASTSSVPMGRGIEEGLWVQK